MNVVKAGAEAVWVHVKANPGTTATQAVLIPLSAFGGPTIFPVLGWMGFSAAGPAAGM